MIRFGSFPFYGNPHGLQTFLRAFERAGKGKKIVPRKKFPPGFAEDYGLRSASTIRPSLQNTVSCADNRRRCVPPSRCVSPEIRPAVFLQEEKQTVSAVQVNGNEVDKLSGMRLPARFGRHMGPKNAPKSAEPSAVPQGTTDTGPKRRCQNHKARKKF